jgi:hypothetical protein
MDYRIRRSGSRSVKGGAILPSQSIYKARLACAVMAKREDLPEMESNHADVTWRMKWGKRLSEGQTMTEYLLILEAIATVAFITYAVMIQ